jgi:hypothetical protein
VLDAKSCACGADVKDVSVNESSNEGFFSILRREPEQTALILKLGFGGPVVIVFWDWAANLLLPELAVSILTLFMILIYAGALTFLIASLVHSADRWQIDAAMEARRLLVNTDSRRRAPVARPARAASSESAPLSLSATAVAEAPHLVLQEPEPAIASEEEEIDAEAEVASPPALEPRFHQVYFLLRVTEEVQRARREGYEMSVLALDVTVPGRELTPQLVEKVSFEMAHIASSQNKVISYSLSLGPTEFVFSLPHLDRVETKDFVSKVVQSLGDYWCHFGVAHYPDDATDAESMVEFARQQCESSRNDAGRKRSRLQSMASGE